MQRCQEHKRRNVIGHLPKRLHPSVSKTIRDAYQCGSKAAAKKRLLRLAARLENDHPDASASLKEGLYETLTLNDLNLPLRLERTLPFRKCLISRASGQKERIILCTR